MGSMERAVSMLLVNTVDTVGIVDTVDTVLASVLGGSVFLFIL
jgi:hypothetical protein